MSSAGAIHAGLCINSIVFRSNKETLLQQLKQIGGSDLDNNKPGVSSQGLA